MNDIFENKHRKLFEFLNPETPNEALITKDSISPRSWNLLWRAIFKLKILQSPFNPTEIPIQVLKNISLDDLIFLKHIGKVRIASLLSDLRNFTFIKNKSTLFDFLNENVKQGYGISKLEFEATNWNTLIRIIVQKKLIDINQITEPNSVPIEFLKLIPINDINEVDSVGVLRKKMLIENLMQVKDAISMESDMSFMHAKKLETKNSLLPNVIDLITLMMITDDNWEIRFTERFGLRFDELEFDNSNNKRDLIILKLRLEGSTLESIGHKFNLTRERVRQILNDLISKANNNYEDLESDLFETYFDKIRYVKKLPELEEKAKWLEIDNKARELIELNPGIEMSFLAKQFNIEEEILRNKLSMQTKKFIIRDERNSVYSSKYSDEDLLEALRLTEAFESPITSNLYNELVSKGLVQGPSSQIIMKRFGTWINACKAADVEYVESVRDSYESQWSKNDILDFIIDFLKDENISGAIESFDQWRIEKMNNAPSGAQIRNIFGTWINARNTALIRMRELQISPNLTKSHQ